MRNVNKTLKVMVLFLSLIIGITMFNFSKSKLDPDSAEFYKYARYLFTKHERKIFLKLPTKEDRERFIRHFWEIRDPNPYTDENEFKLEMEERFEYVSKYLKEGPIPGWKTDRGRIFILLGPPSTKDERYSSDGSIRQIYWYYHGSNIFVLFIDTEGLGIFSLDARYTSLKLLDELKNRKYYINKKKNSNFETNLLDFGLTYDFQNNELLFSIDSKNINYEESDSQMLAKLKIDLIIYYQNKNFTKITEIKELPIAEDKLLEKDSNIELRLPVILPVGKVVIDAIVTDLFGNAVRRNIFKIKVKKK